MTWAYDFKVGMAKKSVIIGRHVNMAPTHVNNYFDNKTINLCKIW